MNKLKAFLAQYDITTHTVAVVFAALVIAYGAVPQFKTFVTTTYNALPAWLEQLALAVIALVAWYRNGQNPTPPATS